MVEIEALGVPVIKYLDVQFNSLGVVIYVYPYTHTRGMSHFANKYIHTCISLTDVQTFVCMIMMIQLISKTVFVTIVKFSYRFMTYIRSKYSTITGFNYNSHQEVRIFSWLHEIEEE